MKSFLERNKLGKYSDEDIRQREEKKRLDEECNDRAAKATKVGDRCEVKLPDHPSRRATVMYIGKAHRATASAVPFCYTPSRS